MLDVVLNGRAAASNNVVINKTSWRVIDKTSTSLCCGDLLPMAKLHIKKHSK